MKILLRLFEGWAINLFNWRRVSLKRQIVSIFFTIQCIIFLTLFLYFTRVLASFHYDHLERELYHQSLLIINHPLMSELDGDTSKLGQWMKEIGETIESRITLVDINGNVLADSLYQPRFMDNHINRSEIKNVIISANREREIRRSSTLGIEMFYLAAPILEEGEIKGIVRLSKSLDELRSIQYQMKRNYLLFSSGIFFFTLLITWKYSASITDLLENLIKATKQMAKGSLTDKIKTHSPPVNELEELGQMFNYMAGELENTIQEISQEKGRFEVILNSMVDGVIATDCKQEITLINTAALQMAGLKAKDIKGKNLLEIFRNYRLYYRLEEVLNNRITASEEIFFPTPEEKFIRCHFAPVTIENDKVIGGVILITDITELRSLEQVRKEFVANVSHELQTPLTSIIGYLETILEGDMEDEETQKRFLKIIKIEADRLAILIKDLLDLSRIERETERYQHLSAHSLSEIIEKAFIIFKKKSAEKGIILKKEVEEHLPPVLMIPEEIEQVFINLIDNAIKYTLQGEIILRAYLKNKKVVVEVQDSGIGIPLENQERIFERFYRVDKTRSRSMGGTGIGLAIVKHILVGHKSEIRVESNPKKGSLFRFYLSTE